MADSCPWSETPSASYIPSDIETLKNRINFLFITIRKKSKEINDITYELEECQKELQRILTPNTF